MTNPAAEANVLMLAPMMAAGGYAIFRSMESLPASRMMKTLVCFVAATALIPVKAAMPELVVPLAGAMAAFVAAAAAIFVEHLVATAPEPMLAEVPVQATSSVSGPRPGVVASTGSMAAWLRRSAPALPRRTAARSRIPSAITDLLVPRRAPPLGAFRIPAPLQAAGLAAGNPVAT